MPVHSAHNMHQEDSKTQNEVSITTVESTPKITFHSMGLNETLIHAVEKSGYTTPTPIQAETIPLILQGRDVLGQAQTGTGKTAAFALPLLQNLDNASHDPQVLVLTPTRELAIQVAKSFVKYAAGMNGFRVVPIYGGQDFLIQHQALSHRHVKVIVGTPGRVIDQIRRGPLRVEGLKTLVLDEADEMLRMGFAEDVDWILSQLPTERQIVLFSATVPESIRRIAQRYQRNPAEITIQRSQSTAETIRQRYLLAATHEKESMLVRILESEPIEGVIVFVRTRNAAEQLADSISRQARRAAALSGNVVQKQREKIVEQLRNGAIDVVVATDVAARGLDVERVSHVINYDPPFDGEAYVHRIGRTGRAGRSGEAILFVPPRDRLLVRNLERATRQKMEPMDCPSNRTIERRQIERFFQKVTVALASPELEAFQKVITQFAEEKSLSIEQIAAALAFLANGEKALVRPEETKSPLGDIRDVKKNQSLAPGFDTYRVEVGKRQQLKPGPLVATIAGNSGIPGGKIGRITIHNDHSTIELPKGIPPATIQILKRVQFLGHELAISRLAATTTVKAKKGSKPKRSNGEGIPDTAI